MRGKKFFIRLTAILAIFPMTFFVTSAWPATQEKVLYSFNPGNGTDGALPYAGLIFDPSGNLYGTTAYGGTGAGGTVFELTPAAGGGWTEKLLVDDGWGIYAGLTLDAAGNLYGTSYYDGDNGCGMVFELTPTSGGGWTKKVLHSFDYDGNGAYPAAGLIFDAAGNLYGTTEGGGTGIGHGGCGAVFELTPTVGGGWTEQMLRSVWPGCLPDAGLIQDGAGNLYGTTFVGGAYGRYGEGTLFEMTSAGDSGWNEAVLHNFNFNNKEGPNPTASLIMDAAGDLFGTTSGIDAGGYGTVFELARDARTSTWTYKPLHIFAGTDGSAPYGALVSDASGNLYGTTLRGGTYGAGTVFKLTPIASGGWTYKLLYSFKNDGTDGTNPRASLIFDAVGNLYGTTAYGGTYDAGTVFEITP